MAPGLVYFFAPLESWCQIRRVQQGRRANLQPTDLSGNHCKIQGMVMLLEECQGLCSCLLKPNKIKHVDSSWFEWSINGFG